MTEVADGHQIKRLDFRHWRFAKISSRAQHLILCLLISKQTLDSGSYKAKLAPKSVPAARRLDHIPVGMDHLTLSRRKPPAARRHGLSTRASIDPAGIRSQIWQIAR